VNPRIKSVKPNPDHTLTLTFTNGEVKTFDVKPYLDMGIFRELRDQSVFNSVRPVLGSIQWKNGQDFCPDTLYMDSQALNGETRQDAQNIGNAGLVANELTPFSCLGY
jgi:hypothetical protein